MDILSICNSSTRTAMSPPKKRSQSTSGSRAFTADAEYYNIKPALSHLSDINKKRKALIDKKTEQPYSSDSGFSIVWNRIRAQRRQGRIYEFDPYANGSSEKKSVPTLRSNFTQSIDDFGLSDFQRKYRNRCYQIALNIFNKKPLEGLEFMFERELVRRDPDDVADLLATRSGISRKSLGDYLSLVNNRFAQDVLRCFSRFFRMDGMEVDVALRRFLAYFKLPGEAQKIEAICEVFGKRYIECNEQCPIPPSVVCVLAFALILLNTDLHSRNLKHSQRMNCSQFLFNLRSISDNLDEIRLCRMYERIKTNEFKVLDDHTSQVARVERTLIGTIGKFGRLADDLSRRLISFCHLWQVDDLDKKSYAHRRDLFLFNDLLLITKLTVRKNKNRAYCVKSYYELNRLQIRLMETDYFKFGIRLTKREDNRFRIDFCTKTNYDRIQFCEDLKEAIVELDESESIEVERQLQRIKITDKPDLNNFSLQSIHNPSDQLSFL